MYKTEVIRKIAKDTRVSQAVAGEVIDAFLNTVQQNLKDGKRVTLPGNCATFAPERWLTMPHAASRCSVPVTCSSARSRFIGAARSGSGKAVKYLIGPLRRANPLTGQWVMRY